MLHVLLWTIFYPRDAMLARVIAVYYQVFY